MHKKILAVSFALLALAVVPALAFAAPHLTTNEGAAAGVGSTITATNTTNIVFTTGQGTVTCSEGQMHGKVMSNTTKLIEGTIGSASVTGSDGAPCTSWFGDMTVTPENLHWCIRSWTLGSFVLSGGACGSSKSLRLTLHFSFGACTYEGASSVSGTYKGGENDVNLLLTGEPEFVKVAGGLLCVSSFKLHAAFRLTGFKIT